MPKITKRVVDAARPAEVDRLVWDAELKGFGLKITPKGRKVYLVKYRMGGRAKPTRRFTIGAHGEIGPNGIPWTPDSARRAAAQLRGKIADGIDPMAEEQAKRRAPAAGDGLKTVSRVLDDFVARYVKKGDRPLRSADQVTRAFDRLVKPRIGALGIYALRRSNVVEMLDAIEDEHGPVMADRTLAYLRKGLTWYAARDDEFNLPIVRGMARTKPKDRARKRVLADDEIRDLWTALGDQDEPDWPDCYPAFIRTLLLTAQRRDEVARMRWDEIVAGETDDDATWIIPAERYKTAIENAVPLSLDVTTIIGKRAKRAGPFVLSSTKGSVPFSGYSKAKVALDRKLADLRAQAGREPMPHWTLHDLRRTARSLMSRAGVPGDIAERVLGHVIPGVRGVYDRHSYAAEKRDALQKLAALVARILNPPPPNVAQLNERRQTVAA